MENKIMAQMEPYILQNHAFDRLPPPVKQMLSNSEKQYEKLVIEYSLSHQLRWKKNLVRKYVTHPSQYYQELLKYSREHLMMYPYHLADIFVDELNHTAFTYYHQILCDMIKQEKSYDSLPNFSAGDCLNVLGIGRNQYIDLMNSSKSKGGLFYKSKKDPRLLLPDKPRPIKNIAYWWTVSKGYVTEEDIKMCTVEEHDVIDRLFDRGKTLAGVLDKNIVDSLYLKNLIYFSVPIADIDMIYVPPLEGFVMNRILGDYFENLLYKIFVTIDAHTTVKELAVLLRQDLQLVKDAVSAYCRLGFAFKRGTETLPADGDWHDSWREYYQKELSQKATLGSKSKGGPSTLSPEQSLLHMLSEPDRRPGKRIAFLFDSTLTAFLMMGNLSPGLKKHAVTMFEAGKLSDEAIDEFLTELDGSNFLHEGEAQAYFEHAMTLRDTVRFLRWNQDLAVGDAKSGPGLGLDLVRCESINSLDAATCKRVLQKNYSVLLSMAPFARETRSLISCSPPHIGPSVPEIESIWFKLWFYEKIGQGPPSYLFVSGTRVRKVPKQLLHFSDVLITSSSNETNVVNVASLLVTLNELLSRSPVLVQGYGKKKSPKIVHVPFPVPEFFLFDQSTSTPSGSPNGNVTTSTPVKGRAQMMADVSDTSTGSGSDTTGSTTENNQAQDPWTPEQQALCSLKVVRSAFKELQLQHSCGFLTLINPSVNMEEDLTSHDQYSEADWTLLDASFGIPLFDANVNKCILQQILHRQLLSADKLRTLMKLHREESLELLHFISCHQDLPMSFDRTYPAKNFSPTPTHSIESLNGVLGRYLNEE